jgi:hypothetical protein
MSRLYMLFYVLLFALLCCRKPYNPPVISSPNSYLVVEGVINSGQDSTIIKLSSTVKLNAKTTINPVLGATVSVESDQQNSYPLIDYSSNGNYASAPLNLSPSKKYRLKIVTADGKQYFSDFIAVKPTPAIDSIGYTLQNNVVHLYVNTHDPANSTHYYRWQFDEAWQFHSLYQSYFVLDPGTNTIVHRGPNQGVYYCFDYNSSSNVILTSTTKLTQDVVYQYPLTSIPITAERLEMKYSILVRQYALTTDAYNFYQNLQKNTEQLGSIFDSQPSQLNGNIHNVNDPNEPVIGYITVTNVQSKRIFISNDVLPKYTVPDYPYQCEEDTAFYVNKFGYNDVQNILINQPLTDVPTFAIYATSLTGIIGYGYSTPRCVDCTLRGSTKTPLFWK